METKYKQTTREYQEHFTLIQPTYYNYSAFYFRGLINTMKTDSQLFDNKRKHLVKCQLRTCRVGKAPTSFLPSIRKKNDRHLCAFESRLIGSDFHHTNNFNCNTRWEFSWFCVFPVSAPNRFTRRIFEILPFFSFSLVAEKVRCLAIFIASLLKIWSTITQCRFRVLKSRWIDLKID